MRARLMMLAFVTLLYCTAQAANNQFDITLEGPWVLYQYNLPVAPGVGAATTPVLIAVAPKVDNIYHLPTVSAGDGYEILQNGIYCLIFAGSPCSQSTGATSLTSGSNYHNTLPLTVSFNKSKTVSWDLVSINKTYALYALVLPMPNSYSNDGVWNMRFSTQLGTNYGAEQIHSIGVQLHYNKGPAAFDLKYCTDLNTAKCGNAFAVPSGHTTITNTGTLRIVMRAPENDNACDPHVRALYHPTLRLLDDSPLASNVNKAVAYIDPARNVDANNVGNYVDAPYPSCYASDPQQQPFPQMVAAMAMHTTLSTQLDVLLEEMEGLGLSEDLMKQIQAGDKLLQQNLASLSELSRLAQALRIAACHADELGKDVLATELRQLADVVQTKNGADCRAPIMLVQ